ncbi:MAG: hypothetical protein II038_10830 [Lachnospiraceae bacterium]|nr:hypothetical protein [Lachnospiraceae bacterium]
MDKNQELVEKRNARLEKAERVLSVVLLVLEITSLALAAVNAIKDRRSR